MQGMGLYIFGDNQPFFVDANRLLDAMAFELDTRIPPLCGNNPGQQGPMSMTYAPIIFPSSAYRAHSTAHSLGIVGGQIVHQRGTGTRGGFIPHLLTTGLTALFEGITVVSVS